MADDQNPPEGEEVSPEHAPPADLPKHARERLSIMKKKHFFTSDLSVNEFLLVKEAGFEPLGMVMGSSIYRIRPNLPLNAFAGLELTDLTQALHDSRSQAMHRMEEEADALDADGIIGVRLHVNLHAFGKHIAEFVAVGTAIKHRDGGNFKNQKGEPFSSDLSGQDFWTLLRSGYRPVGFVMGSCVYYVPGNVVAAATGDSRNMELASYTHSFYDARELAIERLQAEAEDLQAEGIVGVTVEEKEHSWGQFAGRRRRFSRVNAAQPFQGEVLEFFVVGTAVIQMPTDQPVPVPTLVIPANK